MLDFLRHRYPRIPLEVWQRRFARGLVFTATGPLTPDAPFVPALEVCYYREIAGPEPNVRRDITTVHEDADLLVIDKPHMLPVVPSGPYVRNCLLAMIRDATGNDDIVPLHRLDRDTAGLVAFSKRPATRGPLAALFEPGRIRKEYRAICLVRGPLPARVLDVSGRLVMDVPFYKRRLERDGEPNSNTRVVRLRTRPPLAYVRLLPRTGKTHQLRVHLASIGCPILNDRVYAEGSLPGAGQVSTPLQLLASRLDIRHPITGVLLALRTRRRLAAAVLF